MYQLQIDLFIEQTISLLRRFGFSLDLKYHRYQKKLKTKHSFLMSIISNNIFQNRYSLCLFVVEDTEVEVFTHDEREKNQDEFW